MADSQADSGNTSSARGPSPMEKLNKSYVATLSEGVKTAVLKNLIPGLCLQGFALVVLILYFTVQPITDLLNALGDAKTDGGFLFSGLASMICGGLIPVCFLLVQQHKCSDPAYAIPHTLFFTLFWTYKGIEVDAFYRLQAYMYGKDNQVTTIFCKVLTDQFAYTPLWALFTQAVPYLWNDLEFSFVRTWEQICHRYYFTITLPTVLLTNWCIWIPTCAIVYSLPFALQIPLFNLVLVFWSLVLVIASTKQPERRPSKPTHMHLHKLTGSHVELPDAAMLQQHPDFVDSNNAIEMMEQVTLPTVDLSPHKEEEEGKAPAEHADATPAGHNAVVEVKDVKPPVANGGDATVDVQKQMQPENVQLPSVKSDAGQV